MSSQDQLTTSTSVEADANQPQPEVEFDAVEHDEVGGGTATCTTDLVSCVLLPDAKDLDSPPTAVALGENDNAKALSVVGVQVGAAVSRTLASNVVANAALIALEEVGSAAAATTVLVSRAQMQAMGLVALRVPLADATRLEQFVASVAEFTAANEQSLVEIAEMTKAQQLLKVGIEGNIISVLAAAAVQQSVATAYLMAGWSTVDEFKDSSVAVALSGGGSLAGGATGAMVGTLIVPGAGTAIGSLLGSFGGAFVPGLIASRYSQPPPTDGDGTDGHRIRPLRCIECDDGEWLEVIDCSPPTASEPESNQDEGHDDPAEYQGASRGTQPSSCFPQLGDDPTNHSISILHDASQQLLNEGAQSSETGTTREGDKGNQQEGAAFPVEVGETDLILYLKLKP